MRKRELMEFIDKVEHKAVKSVEAKYNKLISEEKVKVLKQKGYELVIEKLQKKINELAEECQNIELDMREEAEIKFDPYYYGLASEINCFAGGNNYLKVIIDNSKFIGGSVDLARNNKDKEVQEVKANYRKVKEVCNSYQSAAKIAEYLKGLGFDLSSLEEKESTALMCKIDKSKLFVCGENK